MMGAHIVAKDFDSVLYVLVPVPNGIGIALPSLDSLLEFEVALVEESYPALELYAIAGDRSRSGVDTGDVYHARPLRDISSDLLEVVVYVHRSAMLLSARELTYLVST